MPEGLYRIVRRGATFRTRTDFSTVLVLAGALVHYKLVLDRRDGSFRGGGVVLPEELGVTTESSPWNRRFSIAVTLPLASSRNVVGATNQTSIGMEAFFDTYVTYQRNRNFVSGIFEIEQGFLKLDPEGTAATPLQKTRDRIRADIFYSRFLRARLGPYARFGLLMTAAPSEALFTEDGKVVIRRLDGRIDDLLIPANAILETSGTFAPVLLRQGAGLNARLLRSRAVTLDVRAGLGLRQNRFNESLFLDDDPASDPLEYHEAPNFDQQGVEGGVVASARYRFLLLNTNLDVFGGFRSVDPTIDWRNTISWRLTDGLSIDYIVDLLRLPRGARREPGLAERAAAVLVRVVAALTRGAPLVTERERMGIAAIGVAWALSATVVADDHGQAQDRRVAASRPSDAGNQEGGATLMEALRSGTAAVALRYRYKFVADDAFVPDAHASTLRTTLGYETAPFHGLSVHLEAENVRPIGADLYDNRGAAHRNNERYERPGVVDPGLTQLNQASLRFAPADGTLVTVGRQEIRLDDERFVGAVGWRQNHQSFDAVRVATDTLPRGPLNYALVRNAHRVTGAVDPLTGHLLHAAFRGPRHGSADRLCARPRLRARHAPVDGDRRRRVRGATADRRGGAAPVRGGAGASGRRLRQSDGGRRRVRASGRGWPVPWSHGPGGLGAPRGRSVARAVQPAARHPASVQRLGRHVPDHAGRWARRPVPARGRRRRRSSLDGRVPRFQCNIR